MSTNFFKDKDYSSNDGMLTYIWGPPLWHFLHTMSFNYPVNPTEKDKRKYKRFMMSVGEILPCKYCRQNYKNNLKSIKFGDNSFNSRLTFSRMVYRLHEEVNRMLKKKSNLSYDEVRSRYENFRARCNLKDLREIEKNIDKELGCTEPENNIPKHKCELVIKPLTRQNQGNSIKFDKKCILKSCKK